MQLFWCFKTDIRGNVTAKEVMANDRHSAAVKANVNMSNVQLCTRKH